MTQVVYFTVITTEDELQYHVSSDRNAVEKGEALSASISKEHFSPVSVLERWFQYAKLYNQIPVQCKKHKTLPLVVVNA